MSQQAGWGYNVVDRPKLEVDQTGAIQFNKPEPQSHLVTWVYDNHSFTPSAKLVDGKSYSIISDYLGTPILSYDENGNKVWERELDIYGKVRKGDSRFIPFLYQGQYYDEETELAYNRFRYYSPDSGTYISQDPIGLEGGMPNFYAYVKDSNSWIDPFGLDCKKVKDTLTGEEFDFASQMPIIKKGSKEWKKAIDSINSSGKSKNFRVQSKADAEELMNSSNRKLTEKPTYTDDPYKAGYEFHPNESHTVNAPQNNLEHIKWKDWSSGKKTGGNGHIFF